MPGTDVEVLARLAAKGDDRAFEAVCRLLSDDVWRYCRALTGDRELAFEAAQETFARSVRAIRRFRGDGPVRVFFLVIARRSVAHVLRHELRQVGWPAGDDLPERQVGDPTGAVDVQALVAVLPPDLRHAFVLTQVLGLDYAEAARVAECPIGTIRSRVFRARERLMAAIRLAEQPEPDHAGDQEAPRARPA